MTRTGRSPPSGRKERRGAPSGEKKKRTESSFPGRRRAEEKGGFLGQVVGTGRGAPVHLPVAMAPADIFPTARRPGRIIAHDYGEDQRDRLSPIWPASVAEVTHAGTTTTRPTRHTSSRTGPPRP